MPIRCYNKPNRKSERVFTAKDAARVFGYALRAGATLEEFIDALRSVGQDEVADLIRREVDSKVRPIVCDRLKPVADSMVSKVFLLNPLVRVVRTGYDVVDGLWQDVESFNIAGVRIPRAITVPVRDFIDKVGELLDSVDDFIKDAVHLLNIFDEECSDG